eukprot:202499_1
MSTEEYIIMVTMAKLPGSVQRTTKKKWAIWKIVAAVLGFLFVLNALLNSLIRYPPVGQLFIYITNWTMIFEAIYLIATCCLCVKLRKYDVEQMDVDNSGKQHWPILCMWILQDFILVCPVAVVIFYWGFGGDASSYNEVIMHVCNVVLVLPDIFFSPLPHRLLHVYVILCVMIIYMLFSIIHYIANIKSFRNETRYIYSALDWGSVFITVTYIILVFLFICLLQFIVNLASMVTRAMRPKQAPNSLVANNLELELPPIAV